MRYFESFQKLVTVACAAWNATVLPADKRESMLVDKRKNKFDPRVERMIVQFKVTGRGYVP